MLRECLGKLFLHKNQLPKKLKNCTKRSECHQVKIRLRKRRTILHRLMHRKVRKKIYLRQKQKKQAQILRKTIKNLLLLQISLPFEQHRNPKNLHQFQKKRTPKRNLPKRSPLKNLPQKKQVLKKQNLLFFIF